MTYKEAKEIFLNRGFVNGLFDGDKWRQSIVVISKWLEQEPCDDCISRAEAQKHIYRRLWESALNNVGYECKAEDVFMDIADNRLSIWVSEIPSIQPNPKTGHWMKQNLGYRCSYCTLCTNEKGRLTYNYCPNCGAKMESEDKE